MLRGRHIVDELAATDSMRSRSGDIQLGERNGLQLVGLEPYPFCHCLPIDAELNSGQPLLFAPCNGNDRRQRRRGHVQVKEPGWNERDELGR